jgi:hypothetical protein
MATALRDLGCVGITVGVTGGRKIGLDAAGPLGAVGGGPDVLIGSGAFVAGGALTICETAGDFFRTSSSIRLLLFPLGSNSTFTSADPIRNFCFGFDAALTAIFADSMAETKRAPFTILSR